MIRVIIGGVLAGAALFVWGYVSWVVLPWHEIPLRQTESEELFLDAVNMYLPMSGWYVFPQLSMKALHEETDAAKRDQMLNSWLERHKKGPIVQVFYRQKGADPMSSEMYVKGVAASVGCGIAAAWLIALTLASQPNYARRVFTVVLAGVVAILMVDLPNWIYMYSPADFTVLMCLDHLIGSVIMGLVAGAVVRARK